MREETLSSKNTVLTLSLHRRIMTKMKTEVIKCFQNVTSSFFTDENFYPTFYPTMTIIYLTRHHTQEQNISHLFESFLAFIFSRLEQIVIPFIFLPRLLDGVSRCKFFFMVFSR